MSEKQFKATIYWSQVFIFGSMLGIMFLGAIAIVFLDSASPSIPLIALSAVLGGIISSFVSWTKAD